MLTNLDASKKPSIKDFIETGKDNAFTLENTMFYKEFNGMSIPVSNVLRDKYRQIVLSLCVDVKFTPDEFDTFRYRPKTLSYKLYGTVDLWHVLLWINNLTSTTQFNLEQIKILNPNEMKIIYRILEKECDNILKTHRT